MGNRVLISLFACIKVTSVFTLSLTIDSNCTKSGFPLWSVAKKIISKGIDKVKFDRGKYKYGVFAPLLHA